VAEAALAAVRRFELVAFAKLGGRDRSDYELCNPVTSANRARLLAGVQENHPQLTAVVRVDGAGRVWYQDPVLERQATARPDLALITRRDRELVTGWYQKAIAGS
jgi:hypothetical protein